MTRPARGTDTTSNDGAGLPGDGPATDEVALVLLQQAQGAGIPRALGRLMFGRWLIAWRERPAGLGFVKVLGSGRGGGFLPWPSLRHHGLLLTFRDRPAAEAFLHGSPMAGAMRAGSRWHLALILRAVSSRGRWAGSEPFQVSPVPRGGASGPVASLTRASIRPGRALRFWRHAPAAERDLRASAGNLLAIGLGEAPLLRQATFTVWESQAAMDAYARSGAHLAAIRATAREGLFSESLFARFEVLDLRGDWPGVTAARPL